MSEIVVENVTKIYNKDTSKEVVALKDISFEIKRGEVTLLMGASGSGKSTLLSLIAGFLKPTFGKVIVKGEVISKLPDNFATEFRRKNIGFIFQKFNLLEDLSVKENILLPLIPIDLDINKMQKRAKKVLKLFKIAHKENQKVSNLSGGEQQRCAIARAMINEPNIILADEPTANLDKNLSFEFMEILKDLKNMGKTIIIATHDSRFEDLEFVDRKIDVFNS